MTVTKESCHLTIQHLFIDNLLNEHGLIDAGRETPMNTVFPETDGTKLSPELHTISRSKLGSLQFLAALTRPDILPITFLVGL